MAPPQIRFRNSVKLVLDEPRHPRDSVAATRYHLTRSICPVSRMSFVV
jgi:hypothetical protein